MLNDPYIEIIKKTKSLHLDEALVEQSIDKFLKEGADKTLFFLVHDRKTPESQAWKLMEEIKKEFRSTYFTHALYQGVFMILSLSLVLVFLVETDITNIWLYPATALFLRFTYTTIKSLVKALHIK